MSQIKLAGYTHSYLLQQVQEILQAQKRLNEQMTGEFELLLANHGNLQLGKPIMLMAKMQIEATKLSELVVQLRSVVVAARKRNKVPRDPDNDVGETLARMQQQIDELNELVRK
jgi:polyhydroxyalkanoate synthesis regulator protein